MAGIIDEASLDKSHLSIQVQLVALTTLDGLGDWIEHRTVLDDDMPRPGRGKDPAHRVHRRHICDSPMECVVHHYCIPPMRLVFTINWVAFAYEAHVLDANVKNRRVSVNLLVDLGGRVIWIQTHHHRNVNDERACCVVDPENGTFKLERECPLNRSCTVGSRWKAIHANVIDPLIRSGVLDLVYVKMKRALVSILDRMERCFVRLE